MFLELFLFVKIGNNRLTATSVVFASLPLILSIFHTFIRGHSFVKLTEHDNSATDIMVQCIVFIYMYCCIHSK